MSVICSWAFLHTGLNKFGTGQHTSARASVITGSAVYLAELENQNFFTIFVLASHKENYIGLYKIMQPS